MPERFAQQALGHSSKAFVRAYSKKARVIVPSLEEYEAKSCRCKRPWFDNITSTGELSRCALAGAKVKPLVFQAKLHT